MIEIGTIGISVVVGFILGYFTSYFNEKGKNKALIEDTGRITEEKEKVSSHYTLDVTKRTFKYEDKRIMYYKYFNLLDEMETEGIKISQEEVLPGINKFMSDYLSAKGNTSKILKAASELSTITTNAIAKMHSSQVKLKRETGSIRLAAGNTVLEALKELEILYDYQFQKSGEMMKDLAKNVSENRQSVLMSQKIEIENIGNRATAAKADIIAKMKAELDEI